VYLVVVLVGGCDNTHFAPKMISANNGKQVGIACSGRVTVSGSQDSYEVSFTDDKGLSHDWRGLHDVQIDDDPALKGLCTHAEPAKLQGDVMDCMVVKCAPLPDDFMDMLKRRNECEARFNERNMHNIDGMSPGEACKQNPDRKP
jgi:hypothetical protein